MKKLIKNLIIYWFKKQASKASKDELSEQFKYDEIQEILHNYWQRYKKEKSTISAMPTIGGSIMVNLASMSAAFYQELISKGKKEKEATQIFYQIAWKIYVKMGRFSWWLAGLDNRKGKNRLLKATQLFRAFPFNSPSYQWEEVQTGINIVGFNCTKCPVAEYFQKNNLSTFCANTWCALDYPLAELWNSKLERTGSIAEGAEKCDFRWIANQ